MLLLCFLIASPPYPTLSLCIPSSSLGLDDFAALALAKAGRAAKAGARAGRLVRLVRLVKIFKFAKWILGRAMRKRQAEDEKEDELENNLHFNMSILGRRVSVHNLHFFSSLLASSSSYPHTYHLLG